MAEATIPIRDTRPGTFDGTVFVPTPDGLVIPLLAEEDLSNAPQST